MKAFAFLLLTAGIAIFLFQAPTARSQSAPAAAAPLSGKVTSLEEGAMEGVLVSAKKEGSAISVTVVSDSQGHYRFPVGRLEPGHYALKIRAGGYDLDHPATVDIAVGKSAQADLTLKKTSNLASQLSNADWLTSFPGTPNKRLPCRVARTVIRLSA